MILHTCEWKVLNLTFLNQTTRRCDKINRRITLNSYYIRLLSLQVTKLRFLAHLSTFLGPKIARRMGQKYSICKLFRVQSRERNEFRNVTLEKKEQLRYQFQFQFNSSIPPPLHNTTGIAMTKNFSSSKKIQFSFEKGNSAQSQCHQHFTCDFFVRMFCEKLFCTQILGLNFFGAKILARIMLVKLTLASLSFFLNALGRKGNNIEITSTPLHITVDGFMHFNVN